MLYSVKAILRKGGGAMERPRYEAVVWDFDGTLVDTSTGIFQSV